MSIKLELIKIVEHPMDRNNWISIEDNPMLAKQFSSLISYYDFIDFEGDVLYFNIISNLINGVKQSFLDIYKTGDVVFTESAFIKLGKLILPNYMDDFNSNFRNKFVEGETIVKVV